MASSIEDLTYYHYSLIICGVAVVISLMLSLILFLIRFIMEMACETKHSEVSKQSSTLYDVYKPKKNFISRFVFCCIESSYVLENAMIMILVFSCLSFLGGATAFGYVHWGISFSVSIIVTMFMSLHAFRYRNLHKMLRKKDFLEQEAAKLLVQHSKTDSSEWGTKNIELVPTQFAATPTDDENVMPTPPSPNTQEYELQKLSPDDIGKCKYYLLQFFTEFDIYFRSLEMGISKYRLFPFFAFLIFCMLFATFLVSFFYGTCICDSPYHFSTTFTRFVNKDPCGKLNVCSLVLNLPETPSREMIVKFYSVSEPESSIVMYGTTEDTIQESQVDCMVKNLNSQQRTYKELTNRYVHTCYLVDLEPDQEYYFQVMYDTYIQANETQMVNATKQGDILTQVYSPVKKFKTLHESSEPVIWISAGEMGISDRASKLLTQAASYDPHFISVTGNMAFDNGFLSCTNRWVEYFKQYEKSAITSSGHMIPILTSIGNYEARFHRYNSDRNDILPYLHMFAHSVKYTPGNHPTFHAHQLSNHSSLIVLDSGVTNSHQSQVDFLNSVWNSEEHSNSKKFAMYHHPLYPSYNSPSSSLSVAGITNWQPVFDNFGVIAAFEGRDRTMKRTNMIKANETVTYGGTIYIGDGSCGVMKTNDAVADRWYLAAYANTPHFWVITSEPTLTKMEAVDENRQVQDSRTLLHV